MRRVAAVGAILIVSGIVFDMIPVRLYPAYNYWFTSPNYFFVRAGSLMIIVSAFWYSANNIQRIHPVTTVLGRESLFVYVLHLVVLYGTAANTEWNLRSILGTHLNLFQSAEVSLVMVIAMVLAAFVWNQLKQKHFNVYRIIQLAGSGVFLYYLFTRDF